MVTSLHTIPVYHPFQGQFSTHFQAICCIRIASTSATCSLRFVKFEVIHAMRVLIQVTRGYWIRVSQVRVIRGPG